MRLNAANRCDSRARVTPIVHGRTDFRSVGIIIRGVASCRVARAKSRICTWPGPGDKFQRNLAGRASLASLLLLLSSRVSPHTHPLSLLTPPSGREKLKEPSASRGCANVSGKIPRKCKRKPGSVTPPPSDFLSPTCFSLLYFFLFFFRAFSSSLSFFFFVFAALLAVFSRLR